MGYRVISFDKGVGSYAPAGPEPKKPRYKVVSPPPPPQARAVSEAAQPQQPLNWSDVPGLAVQNAPESAKEFGNAMVQPILHPVETAQNIDTLARGGVMHVPGVKALNDFAVKNLGFQDSFAMPDAEKQYELAGIVGQFYKERYGSKEGFKRALATDPVGVLADFSTVLTGGGTALAKVPGTAARVSSKGLLMAGKATNPITAVSAPASLVQNRVAAPILGLTTGTGGDAVKEAFRAGKRGGAHGNAFRQNMRGQEAQESVLTDAKAALGKMAAERSADYRKGMAATKANNTVLDYQPVENAMGDIVDTLFHGPVATTDDASLNLARKVGTKIDEWQQNYPRPTPEDFDRLKVAIDKLKPNWTQDSGDQSRIIASARTAVKDEVLRNDPTYAKTMKAYEENISAQQEIERALSLGKRASNDTALRKMQSVMRNNVNTNYGSRKNHAQKLQEIGAELLMPKLAGQSMSAVTPRGLASLLAGGMGTAAWAAADPSILSGLLMTSPRIVGELVHGLGRLKRRGQHAPLALYQAGHDASGQ